MVWEWVLLVALVERGGSSQVPFPETWNPDRRGANTVHSGVQWVSSGMEDTPAGHAS